MTPLAWCRPVAQPPSPSPIPTPLRPLHCPRCRLVAQTHVATRGAAGGGCGVRGRGAGAAAPEDVEEEAERGGDVDEVEGGLDFELASGAPLPTDPRLDAAPRLYVSSCSDLRLDVASATLLRAASPLEALHAAAAGGSHSGGRTLPRSPEISREDPRSPEISLDDSR